jgi:beta-phosphoglucomutase-like phosphatase (HAD superfamily)
VNFNLTYFYTRQIRLDARSENCLVREDAPVEVEAAKRADMTCIALITTSGEINRCRPTSFVESFAWIALSRS